MENKKMVNPKTYTFMKYIFTFGLLLGYVISLFSFMKAINKIFSTENQDIYLKINVTFMVLSIVAIFIYIFLRFMVHKKTGFKYNKFERIMVILWLSFVGVLIILMICLFSLSNVIDDDKFKIIWYSIFPFIMIFGICSSIFESRSRIEEQIFIYKKWEQENKEEEIKEAVKDEKKDNKIKKSDTKIEEKEKSKDVNPFMEGDE